jgi:hypothetical protein
MLVISIEQLKLIFEYHNIHIIGALGGADKLTSEAYEWLISKIDNFSETAALEQVEKNLIYYSISCDISVSYTVKYLMTGEPKIPLDMILAFANKVGRDMALQYMNPTLAFLQGHTDVLPTSSPATYNWYKLRSARNLDMPAYLKFLQLEARIYHIVFRLAQNHLIIALQNPKYAALASQLQKSLIMDALKSQIIYSSEMITVAKDYIMGL